MINFLLTGQLVEAYTTVLRLMAVLMSFFYKLFIKYPWSYYYYFYYYHYRPFPKIFFRCFRLPSLE